MTQVPEPIAGNIEPYFGSHERKGILRFITCSCVDDGKSTLVGRLLYDSRTLCDHQLAALPGESRIRETQGDNPDFALRVAGLSAEREQGINVDVAYRYFSAARRKVIVADTRGREQYMRNMVANDSVGAGMLKFALRRAQHIDIQHTDIDRTARSALKGQKACVLWLTCLSGAGKSTVANLVEKKLNSKGRHTYILDGDDVRHGLTKDLGFTAADRVENIRRIAEIAKLVVDAGLIVLTAFISSFRAERRMARALFKDGEFFEKFVYAPLSVAEQRDPKGLYKNARHGEIKNFTGIDSHYEEPESPEIRVDTTSVSPEAAADQVLAAMQRMGLISIH